MFKTGDLVVFKQGDIQVFEIADNSVDSGCDLWNEDDYLLNVNADQIRLATPMEQQRSTFMRAEDFI